MGLIDYGLAAPTPCIEAQVKRKLALQFFSGVACNVACSVINKPLQIVEHTSDLGATMPNSTTEVTTENWRDSDTHLTVSQQHGYFCNLQMLARVNLSPEEVGFEC